MKVTPGSLQASDYETLYTHDPAYFIESLIVNLAYSATSKQPNAADLDKHKQVFLKWVGFYTNSIKEQLTKEVSEAHAKHVTDLLVNAERRGRLNALANLPLKPSLIGPDRLDMHKVNSLIKEYKAQEPKGVTKGDNH